MSTLCLLAPLTLSACVVIGGSEAGESETGDGDGDPGDGDGDGDPGDGDGDPGDGDGDPGDGDGDPGDGDGDPGDGDGDGDPGDGDGDPGDGDGDGDGDPGDGDGDGDGDPGTCDAMDATWGPEDCFNPRGWFWDGSACQQIFCTCDGSDCNSLFADEASCLAEYNECTFGGDCAPFDAQGVGPCEAWFGVTWTGDNCVGVSGCSCEGDDCDNLYEDSEQCWEDHPLCELGDPCAKEDAIGTGDCDAFFGYAWSGSECLGVSGCQCEGADCPDLAQQIEECQAAHAECLPPNECAGLEKAECMADVQCMPINGSQLVKEEEDWCSMGLGFLGCDEEAACLQVLTWGCGPLGEVAQFPSSCLPPGWAQCEPPVLEAPPC